MRIVRKDRKNTAKLNDHLKNQIFKKIVRKEMDKAGSDGRAAIRKPY